MARNTVTQGVSLPTDLLELALEAAEAQHRSFSNYIQRLIAQDIEASKQAAEVSAQGQEVEK